MVVCRLGDFEGHNARLSEIISDKGTGLHYMKFTELPQRWIIAAICVATHALAIPSFGAVFWIDAIHYANLGIAISKADGIAQFYQGIGTWFFSHLQPGLPVLGILVGMLPVDIQWLTLAVAQHALAAFACYFFFITIDRFWPSRWNFLGCFLLNALPSYQAAHGSFMTESLNSSLMLLGLSQAIRLVKQEVFQPKQFLRLLALLVLITQFRSYSGGVVVGAAFLVLYRHRLVFSRHTLACLFAIGAAATAYPTYRFALTGVFWLPTAGMNSLMAGWWVNPNPSASALRTLVAAPAPAALEAGNLVNRGLDYDDAIALGRYWQSLGMSDREINAMAQDLGSTLRNDGWGVRLNRVALGLASSGMVLPYCLAPDDVIVFPLYTAKQMCAHQRNTYLFQSWIALTNQKQLFQSFFELPSSMDGFAFQQFAKSRLAESMKAYLTETPILAKDPLLMGRLVPPDIWVISGILSLLLLVRRERYLAVMCAWIVLSNFVVAYSFPLGNPRYAYALFPIYIGLCCVAASTAGRPVKRNKKSA